MTDDITRYDAVEALLRSAQLQRRATTARCTSVQRAERYDVEIHRWGADRKLVWTATDLPGVEHPTPVDADANGCDWPVAVTVPIGELAQRLLPRHPPAHDAPADRAVGYAGFVVRAGTAAVAGAAGDGHQHLQRVQQLGWEQPLHRWHAGLVRPAVRPGDAGATRRPNATTASRGRSTAAKSPTSTG